MRTVRAIFAVFTIISLSCAVASAQCALGEAPPGAGVSAGESAMAQGSALAATGATPAVSMTTVKVDFYEDGGTIVIQAKDNDGKETVFGVDERLMSPDKGSIFVGADYPDKPGAQKVDRGSAQETEIIQIAQDLAKTTIEPQFLAGIEAFLKAVAAR